MSAKEMFKKLGYKYEDFYTCIICTYSKVSNLKRQCKEIHFFKESQNMEIISSYNGDLQWFVHLDIKEIKAINKQIEELGWNK